MKYLTIKNLTKEILKNRIFLLLLFVMTAFTSSMFFFIRFSIDANMANLKALPVLTEYQQNYMNALKSNTSLAAMFLLIITLLTAFVFVMFYFRFFSSAKKQIGVCKALGIKNINIQLYFALFAAVFSLAGLLTGMLAGFFISSVPMNANARSYNVSGLVKGINLAGALTGLGLPLLIFTLTMFFCGFNLYKMQNGTLLSDIKQTQKQSKLLHFADLCVRRLPVKNKAPLRIAIRKPLPVLLIIIASTVFTVMLVMGWSLTLSSETLYKMQTDGHNYLFESTFQNVQSGNGGGLHYLSVNGTLHSANGKIFEYNDEDEKITQTLFGMDINTEIYDIKTKSGESLGLPEDGGCYISLGLAELYKIRQGQTITLQSESGEFSFTVSGIAYNAKTKTIIVSRQYLCGLLGLNADSYNGVLSIENLYPSADNIIDNATRQDNLARDKVSGATSAIINQSVGLASGIILIFLALLIAFQDSIKDMLIMDNLGYTGREIKKLLINVFLPVLILGFIIMAFPSVLIAKAVQASLSLQMGDYMPFSTNILVLIVGLVAIVAIYWLVQLIFSLGIKQITKKKGILEYTNSI